MRIPDQRSRGPRAERNATIAALGRLPPPDDASFPRDIRQLSEKLSTPERVFENILDDGSLKYRTRFAALYGLLLRLRREERSSDYRRMVRQHEGEFGEEPYFYTFRAIAERMNGDLTSLRSAVEYSRKAASMMPDVAAVVHQLAEFWVEYAERRNKPAVANELEEIERQVDRAITLSHGKVGHYLETKARVLALRSDFEAARAAVARAVEIEPRESRDYLRRLTQYQTTRVRIDLLEERERWRSEQEAFRSELAQFRGQQLQLLGLLAAIVAFIVTAVNIASETGGVDGIRLIMVASGCIGFIFAAFSFMTNNNMARVGTVAGLAIVMTATGILFPSSWVQ